MQRGMWNNFGEMPSACTLHMGDFSANDVHRRCFARIPSEIGLIRVDFATIFPIVCIVVVVLIGVVEQSEAVVSALRIRPEYNYPP